MRRPSNASRRRAADQCARLAQDLRLALAGVGLSVNELACRSGMSWSTARRVLDGDPSLSTFMLFAVAEAVGIDVVLRAYPGRPPGLRDAGQLSVANALRGIAHASWQPILEMRAGEHMQAIDLCFLGASEIVACEIERSIIDWQAQYRRADAKRRALAAEHGRPVRLAIAVEDTRRNRVALAAHLPLIRTSLPAGSREVLRCLRTGRPLGMDGLLWVRRRRARDLS